MLKSFWRSLVENKRNIFLATFTFILSVIIGYFFIDKENQLIKGSLEQLIGMIDEIKANDSIFYMIITIFKNNLMVALLMIILGLFFGIIPIFILISNGLIIGYLMKLIVDGSGESIGFFLVGILPHGIFEIPAIIISAAFGMRLGFAIFRYIINLKSSGYNKLMLKHIIKQTPYVFLGIAIMLLAAAIIESTLTGFLLSKFYAF